MKQRIIKVPDGIRYLGQWTDFGKELPTCHFILNKVLTDVGATEYFLSSQDKVIFCSPRVSLIENKLQKHPEMFAYRGGTDNVTTDSGKEEKEKASFDKVKDYIDDTVLYVHRCTKNKVAPKIAVTYDSLGQVTRALKMISDSEPESWTVVVDEFQVIYSDSAFKSLTEMKFLDASKAYKRVVFLSATPYQEKYLDNMDEFKDLEYLMLEWPDAIKRKVEIINICLKKDESRNIKAVQIIEKVRDGKTLKFGSLDIDTKEVVFYINNLRDILYIIKKCRLNDKDVNILCSKSREDKLKKEGFSLGKCPGKGDPHKPFTFCTRSNFLGVDMYSECAISIIFADPASKTLALDMYTDLPQIMGRQRLETNPYRDKAILFYKQNSTGEELSDFASTINTKIKETESLIKTYEGASDENKPSLIRKYRQAMKSDHFKSDYIAVTDDPVTGKPVVGFNNLYKLAEMRAWEISKDGYKNQYIIMRDQVNSGLNPVIGTASNNPEVLKFMKQYYDLSNRKEQLRLYCEFRKEHDDLVGELDFVARRFEDYWNALGYDILNKLQYQESKIKKVLEEPKSLDAIFESVVLEVRNQLEKDKKYSCKGMKEKLQKIYKSKGYHKKAKAVDVYQYVTATEKQEKTKGKRQICVTSLFQKNITLFPLVRLPNKPKPMDIDRFLDIIKTGEYKINASGNNRTLKEVIGDIRNTGDHTRQSELKKNWLPVGCINGSFDYKDDNGLKVYSSFLALDYDGFKSPEDLKTAKEDLKKKPYIYALFVTPSGNGLKVIVLHDSVNPLYHDNLIRQVMKDCSLMENDPSVTDLSRGHFLSYDPELWKNDDVEPYQFKFDPAIMPQERATKTVMTGSNVVLDDPVSDFLYKLDMFYHTDDAILKILDTHWKKERSEYFTKGNRHHSILIIGGTLCKAGVDKERALEYLEKNYQGINRSEIKRNLDYCYESNPFGCDRRRYD